MGNKYTLYVGPVVACKNREITTQKELRTCSNPECTERDVKKPGDHIKFCSRCGSQIEVRYQNDVKPAISVEWDEELEDILFMPPNPPDYDFDYFLPNQSFAEREIYFDGESANIDLDDDFLEKELEAFFDKFENQIQYLINAYGEGNVMIIFKLFSYWG